jgi:Fe-S-cluster containining protein
MNQLFQLHADIDARVQTIRDHQPQWLCGKGCGGCCRSLAAVPRLSAAEWRLLEEGLATLAPPQLQSIAARMAAIAGQNTPPLTCPLLDLSTDACPVYAQRPVACRTYGFYVQRDLGVYCPDIESQVAAGALADVVWGNHDVIDQRLAGLGESKTLDAWFADSPVNRPDAGE